MTFDEDVLRYLEAYARQVDRKVAYVVREILREWMDARIAAEAQTSPARTPSVPPFDASGPAMGGS